ncbi:uncharacterized oxidoreductase TM_0325-like [Nymphalis io]|uniref:uncharacterized oxidoreductase TM_0325-like n=1 Tax=Inachis io TaxID=171585 RepID=UPI002166FF6A|nr:uncharacterized oxidoreductase TM_0325-like [Nymphalis io]
MDFTNKIVLITGASSGIGAATAIYFSKLSAKLALTGRNENNLKKIALYCEKAKGIKPLTVVADLTEDLDVEKLVKETIDHYGRIDVLINNAGVLAIGGIKDTNMEMYDKVMSTNMRAVYHLTMLCVPHLSASKGSIINVSSINSSKAYTNYLPYNISKAALDHFTKCVALELAPDGVRVNSVNPSFVKTNILKYVGLTDDQIELLVQNVVGRTPMKKIVEASEVAALIAFLASDLAKSITGSCMSVDGGSKLQ